MTNRRHVDADLVGPPGLKPAGDEGRGPEGLLKPPVSRSVAAALFGHDRHFLPVVRIAANRRGNPAGGGVEAAPDQREIFTFERPGSTVICEQLGQAPMRRVGLGRDQKA